ncbi:MAG: hypothetical protein ACETV1_05320 [Candidatus Bathyarchaeia archaeon]
MEVAQRVRRNIRLIRRARLFASNGSAKEDLVLDIIWALQDIAVIRIVGANFRDQKGIDVVNEYFHLLLDHLILEDFPKHGMSMENITEVKIHLEKAKAYPIDSDEWDGNLAAADGTLVRTLSELLNME